jgi:hypothetical protein
MKNAQLRSKTTERRAEEKSSRIHKKGKLPDFPKIFMSVFWFPLCHEHMAQAAPTLGAGPRHQVEWTKTCSAELETLVDGAMPYD